MNLKEYPETGGGFDRQPLNELSKSFVFLNLLKLSPGEEDELKSQIENQGGHVDILVHPYYEDFLFSKKPAFEYYQQRDKFIRDTLTNRKPLILFEEEYRLDERKLLLSSDFKSGSLYTVSTYRCEPTPIIPAGETLTSQKTVTNNGVASWDYLGNVLTRMSVNHITIGGRHLTIEINDWWEKLTVSSEKQPNVREWLKGNKIPYGCVGNTAIELARRGLDVSFSPITYPSVWKKTLAY